MNSRSRPDDAAPRRQPQDRLKLIGCVLAFFLLPLLAFLAFRYAAPVVEKVLNRSYRGPLLLLLGAGITGYGAWLTFGLMAQRRWPTVTGVVEASHVHEAQEFVPAESIHGRWRLGDRQVVTLYRPVVQYRYRVGDSEHTGELARVPYMRGETVSVACTADRPRAERIVAAHPVGSSVVVFVHPSSPEISTVTPGRLWRRGAVLLAVGLLVLAIRFLLWPIAP